MKILTRERGVSSTTVFQTGGGGSIPTRSLQFDSSFSNRCVLVKSNIHEMHCFVLKHYLKKRPAVCVLVLKVELDFEPVGMVVFSIPPREIEKRYGGKTVELARLYLVDDMPKNSESWVISKSLKVLHKKIPDVKFVVSYADPSVGHTGQIYKATNWIADGKTDVLKLILTRILICERTNRIQTLYS